MTECTPHELLPIMPPRCSDCASRIGSEREACCSAASRSSSSTSPAPPAPVPRRDRVVDPRRYLLQSSTTATLQHCPARLVPPPRARTGARAGAHGDGRARCRRRARHDDADRHLPVVRRVGGVERAAPASNRTSPSTASRRSRSSEVASPSGGSGLRRVPDATRCALPPSRGTAGRRPPSGRRRIRATTDRGAAGRARGGEHRRRSGARSARDRGSTPGARDRRAAA